MYFLNVTTLSIATIWFHNQYNLLIANHTSLLIGPTTMELVELVKHRGLQEIRPLIYSTTELNIAPSHNVESNYVLVSRMSSLANVNTTSVAAHTVPHNDDIVAQWKMWSLFSFSHTLDIWRQVIMSESTCVLVGKKSFLFQIRFSPAMTHWCFSNWYSFTYYTTEEILLNLCSQQAQMTITHLFCANIYFSINVK